MRARVIRLLSVAAIVGCTEKQPEPTPQADTTPTGPVENTNPTPPPPPEPSRIGQLPLLRGAPFDARCSAGGDAAQRLTMEGDAPLRTITIGIGPANRPFVPTYLSVSSKQSRMDGQEENETIYVSFTETGAVESGRRQYFISGAAPKDASPIKPEDGDPARRLAQQVLERCKPA